MGALGPDPAVLTSPVAVLLWPGFNCKCGLQGLNGRRRLPFDCDSDEDFEVGRSMVDTEHTITPFPEERSWPDSVEDTDARGAVFASIATRDAGREADRNDD